MEQDESQAAVEQPPELRPQTVGYMAVRRLGKYGHKGTRVEFHSNSTALVSRLSRERNSNNVWRGFILILETDGSVTAKPV